MARAQPKEKETASPAPNKRTRTLSYSTVMSETPSTASEPTPKPKAKKVKAAPKASDKVKVAKAKPEKAVPADAKEVKEKVVKEKPGKSDGAGGAKVAKRDKDGKEKVEKFSGGEAERIILEYLKVQNRPYGATDVSANLHGKVTKTVADKLLKEMEQDGRIKGKATNGDKKGSQWVFWAIQDPADSATPAELAEMDKTITELRETILPPLKSRLKELNKKLSVVLSSPSTADLSVLVENLANSNKEKRDRLEGLKELVSSGKGFKKDEAEAAQKEHAYWKTKMTVRRRCFKDLEGMLLDGMSKEDLWEKAGLEEVESY
ncbi:Tat binding protein 1-interacting protein-domain-containing protein [Amylocarpus encephaloides]|uniref:Tat binding protein 1-interacting protein-domain-containing protein n=1 Tax=Amylocarpus encephaloides TaxID=45428 RepID=A0A9P7YG58_9HELO|nr:Tat binding protein 1-interacting protein-domain-containing protein [Amylocarpus encephaloides]